MTKKSPNQELEKARQVIEMTIRKAIQIGSAEGEVLIMGKEYKITVEEK